MGKIKFLFGLAAVMLIIMTLLTGCHYPAESPIPSRYKTYTDETGLFSISFPQEWSYSESSIKEMNLENKDVLQKIADKQTLKEGAFLFYGGVPAKEDWPYEPYLSVYVGPLDKDVQNQTQFAKGGPVVRLNINRYTPVFERRATVSGREATIFSFFYQDTVTRPLPHCLSPIYAKQMLLFKDSTFWAVTCDGYEELCHPWSGDIEWVIRSLRILK